MHQRKHTRWHATPSTHSSLGGPQTASLAGAGGARRQTLPLPPMLLGSQPEILPRYVAYYTQLRALPRRVRRALQRQWRQSLAGVALLLALGDLPGHAATIEVTDTCSLVDAIRAANTDTAQGGCPAGEGADTIRLPQGSTQTLQSVHNTAFGPTGLPVIRSVVTIAGRGSTIVRDREAPAFGFWQ